MLASWLVIPLAGAAPEWWWVATVIAIMPKQQRKALDVRCGIGSGKSCGVSGSPEVVVLRLHETPDRCWDVYVTWIC